MPDRLVDVYMTMGLKGLFRNYGWHLESVVCAFMRIYEIDFDRIRKEMVIADVYL